MVFEYLGIINLVLNDFLAQHIVFISHVFAAAFLLLSENTITFTIINNLMNIIEDSLFGKIIIISSVISTTVFILWAIFAIYIYEILFRWLLSKFYDYMGILLLSMFLVLVYVVNVRYRN